jgi:hypothetical protein
MAMKKHILTLCESEIEKAQIVMAVNSEIVNKLQRDAEKVANMKVDVLGPIVDRIKAEHGLEAAEAFRDTVSGYIDQALDTLMQVKDKIYTETLKLTGDVSNAKSLETDLGISDETPDDFSFDDTFSTDEPEPVPVDREMKESYTKLGIVVESKLGTVGNKYFKSAKEMKIWVNENQSKIKTIHRVIKE